MSLKEKINSFNKPEVNEDEEKEKQRKKASYNAKIAKFESKVAKPAKSSAAKIKARMFEDMGGQKEREKEAEIRKEDFKKKKEIFNDEIIVLEESTGGCSEVSKILAVFEPSEDAAEEIREALERERRREEFLEKQTLFGQ